MADGKILAIDDEKNIRHLIRSEFTLEGFDVTTAGSGEEGLEKFNRDKFDVVFLDLKLPEKRTYFLVLSVLEHFEQIFDGFPEVLQVQELNVTQDGKDVTEFKTQVSETRVSTAEQLTPAVLLAAEKRLSEILGPVASVIVESVKDQCSDAGELYRRLAAELNDDEERRYFLSIVDKK